MTQKKGQAAMEFLMTYGWAILAAIIAIGVLAYFGVFSPGRIAGDSATLSAPFFIEASALNTSTLQLELLQNSGGTVNITTITASGTGSSSGVSCTVSPGINHISGNLTLYGLPCTGTLNSGDSFTADLTVSYVESGSSLTQTSSGTVRETVN